jgi:hypothetical protein
VQGQNLRVIVPLRDLLRPRDGFLCFDRKFVETHP